VNEHRHTAYPAGDAASPPWYMAIIDDCKYVPGLRLMQLPAPRVWAAACEIVSHDVAGLEPLLLSLPVVET